MTTIDNPPRPSIDGVIGAARRAMAEGQGDAGLDLLIAALPGPPSAAVQKCRADGRLGEAFDLLAGALLGNTDTESDAEAEAAADLGYLRSEQQRFGEAEDAFRAALSRQPDLARAWLGLGNLRLAQGQLTAAEAAYGQVLRIRPDHLIAPSNLGLALHRQGRSDEAARALRQVLAVQPDNFEALVNLGVVLRDTGVFAEALALHEKALTVRPGFRGLDFDMSLLRLSLGDLEGGFRDYENRWTASEAEAPFVADIPVWQGEPLHGKRILAMGEQGLGDTLQFMRYATLLKRQGASVVLACPPQLTRLMLEMKDLDAVWDGDGPAPAADFQIPLMSLPCRCGTRLDTIPAEIPYLAAPHREILTWKKRLGKSSCLRVGLVWAGAPRPTMPNAHAVDRRRSLPLAALAPLGAVPGMRFISLQLGPAREQLRAPPAGLIIEDHMDLVEDFADTAGLVQNLDLVIGADTSVVHLAGALGKPVWVLSRLDGCWRWLTERDDSPWYPSLRLFRQTRPADWDEVMARVAAALRQYDAK